VHICRKWSNKQYDIKILGPYLPAPSINHNNDIPPTPDLVLFVATARLQPGMTYHTHAKMNCWNIPLFMWVQNVQIKMYLADIWLSKLHPALVCAWPTNLGTLASFCFVQLSENHTICGRISEVGIRSRHFFFLHKFYRKSFLLQWLLCVTHEMYAESHIPVILSEHNQNWQVNKF